MGTKPSINMTRDRPESGGADRNGEREMSGLLERAKQEFARARQDAKEPHQASSPEVASENEGMPAFAAAPEDEGSEADAAGQRAEVEDEDEGR